MSNEISQLILVVTVSYNGAVGFGDLFDCEIERVLTGVINEPRIRISILASDKDTLQFILAHLHPKKLKIGFTLHKRGEPYKLSPISGFVDRSNTSWKIDFVEEAEEQ